MKKIYLTILSGALFSAFTLISASCSEKAEQAAADETADQMMDPEIAGRNAARQFINREWTDTIQLQNALLDAKTKQSEYLRRGEPENAEKFDTAFIRTIRTVRPDLYKEIFR